jgi:hypothetical protein
MTYIATTFTPSSGPIGTAITVYASGGWYAYEAVNSVVVGGVPVAVDLVVSSVGAINGTITVPLLSSGLKEIVIVAAHDGVVTFPDAFNILPIATSITPASGHVGQVITVTGTGWNPSEIILSATIGEVSATESLVIGKDGGLSGTLTCPTLYPGSHSIIITGSISGAQTVSSTFLVTAVASFSPSRGYFGQTITASGTGWASSETIAVDGVTIGGVLASNSLVVSSGVLTGSIVCPYITSYNVFLTIVITGSVSGAQTFSGAFLVLSAKRSVKTLVDQVYTEIDQSSTASKFTTAQITKWISEAQRLMVSKTRPIEAFWSTTTIDGQREYTPPGMIGAPIQILYEVTGGGNFYPVEFVPFSRIDFSYNSSGDTSQCSLWNGQLILDPPPNGKTLQVYYFKYPSEIAYSDTSYPDIDDRFSDGLIAYAASRCQKILKDYNGAGASLQTFKDFTEEYGRASGTSARSDMTQIDATWV